MKKKGTDKKKKQKYNQNKGRIHGSKNARWWRDEYRVNLLLQNDQGTHKKCD